jgi:hypothetical protein
MQSCRVSNKILLPFKNIKVLDQIELYEVQEKVYAVKVEDQKIRAFLFLRYQEFYESHSEEFRSNHFSINDYVDFYVDFTQKGMFTYGVDWSGFNIPSNVIEECMKNIPDKNEYDRIMKSIVDTIKQETNNGLFYLIGVDSVDNSWVLRHEVAHGLYFTNQKYKYQADAITSCLSKTTHKRLKEIIMNMGYNEFVVNDEINAYLSTGAIKSMLEIKGIEKEIKKYEELFSKFFKEEKKSEKIDIKWGN